MNIEISGKTKHICKAEIKFATAFFAKYLMGDRLSKNLDIELLFENQGKMAEGHCSPTEHSRNPRSFEIGINPKLRRYKMLQCLAHEMVHVRQLAKGIMKFAPNEVRYWKGKRYTKKTKYLDMPWELDAFSKQEILLRRAIDTK